MRRMSFALTTEQVKRHTKTVTRRVGWEHAFVGMKIQPVEKCQGLKKGESMKLIGGPIRVTRVSRERLNEITYSECIREGFPGMSPADFIQMFTSTHAIRELVDQPHGEHPKWIVRRCRPDDLVTRIEFVYEPTGQW